MLSNELIKNSKQYECVIKCKQKKNENNPKVFTKLRLKNGVKS